MEDTLREVAKHRLFIELGLNPCFNGRYSQRLYSKLEKLEKESVLILVLMEDTLRA